MRSLRLLALPLVLAAASSLRAEILRVQGSAAPAAPLLEAAPQLKELGVDLKIESDRNSSTAIAAVAAGEADLAIATRPVTAKERATTPALFLEPNPIAFQILALVVPRDVWEGGVHALGRDEMRLIYEGQATNWSQFGGPNRKITFYNPKPGLGLWELFVTWTYGDMRKAGLGERFEQMTTPEQTLNLVEFTPGALSVAPVNRSNGRSVFALGLKSDSGEVQNPTVAATRSQEYPLGRRIDLVSAQRPSGAILRVIEFMRGPEGRSILKRHDCLPWDDGK